MKKSIIVAMLAMASFGAAQAQTAIATAQVGEGGKNKLMLLVDGKASCPLKHEVLFIQPKGLSESGCWTLIGDLVRVTYETGSTFTYAEGAFTIIDDKPAGNAAGKGSM